ncbi:MAG: hypothetical protein HRT38_06415 [Alteromonadaceae bacterium]|nr:hypothetical protein [Alteromonadaceae bacterium]
MLEIYALRWGIEVYFKEVKQKLGFFKEQSRHSFNSPDGTKVLLVIICQAGGRSK